MNRVEAKDLLIEAMNRVEATPYADLRSLIMSQQTNRCDSVRGPSGAEYQIELDVMWDDPSAPEGDIRIIGSIDDGGWNALMPLTRGTIVFKTD